MGIPLIYIKIFNIYDLGYCKLFLRNILAQIKFLFTVTKDTNQYMYFTINCSYHIVHISSV